MKLYKLTDSEGRTRARLLNATQWGENITHKATGAGAALCTDGVIHAYTSPLLAVLMNPAHASITNPVLWESEGTIVTNRADKVGVKTLTTLRKIPLPAISTDSKIRFAIAAALQVYKAPGFVKWAMAWLDGTDRTPAAAYAAAAHKETAAAAAAYAAAAHKETAAAAYAAAYAAAAAAYAAYAAVNLQRIAEWAITDAPYSALSTTLTP